MKIETNNRLIFEFTPKEYFLVCHKFGEWSLNPRIDRSEKGKKDDDCGSPVIFLTEEEAEMAKKAGFSWITY